MLKNIYFALAGFLVGILFLAVSQTWGNRAASYSSATQVLTENGHVQYLEQSVIFTANTNSFSIEELESLAKIAKLKEGVFIVIKEQ